MYQKQSIAAVAAFALGITLLSSCSDNQKTDSLTDSVGGTTESQAEAVTLPASESAEHAAVLLETKLSSFDLETGWDESATEIRLNGSGAVISGSGAQVRNQIITISKSGTYVLSGTLEDGQVVVDAADKVQLVLNGATISNSKTAPLCVNACSKLVLTLAEGTDNALTDGGSLSEAADAPNAALYAKEDLTINGAGSLTVNGTVHNGIGCKDTLVVAGGQLTVKAVANGIKGKDAVVITDGTLNIDAGADGIKADNTEDATRGYVVVTGGDITVTAKEDGVQAETCAAIGGGTLKLQAGGGSANSTKTHTDGMGGMPGRGFNRDKTAETTASSAADTAAEEISTKGIKAGAELYIGGGTVEVDAADDGLHTNGAAVIAGGTLSIASGDDGVHADTALSISDGQLTVSKSYEGLEAQKISVTGGEVSVTASDDGFNASDGSASGGQRGGMGDVSESCSLTISGGNVVVDAGGDGLDSNGSITISGGLVLVNGPTNDGNGALDSGSSLVVSGGTLIAAGSSGMAEKPDDDSTQKSLYVGYESDQAAGTLISVADAAGETLLAFAPTKTYACVIISTPALRQGETYTVSAGGSCDGQAVHGFYDGGKCTGGTAVGSAEISGAVTTIGKAGGMQGFGGGQHGGFPQGRPDSMPDGNFPEGLDSMPEGFGDMKPFGERPDSASGKEKLS